MRVSTRITTARPSATVRRARFECSVACLIARKLLCSLAAHGCPEQKLPGLAPASRWWYGCDEANLPPTALPGPRHHQHRTALLTCSQPRQLCDSAHDANGGRSSGTTTPFPAPVAAAGGASVLGGRAVHPPRLGPGAHAAWRERKAPHRRLAGPSLSARTGGCSCWELPPIAKRSAGRRAPPYPPERQATVTVRLPPAKPAPRQATTGVGCKEKAPHSGGCRGQLGIALMVRGQGNPAPTTYYLPGQLQPSNTQGGLG
jgi:hypothetical protein